jgi:hypothetical protein
MFGKRSNGNLHGVVLTKPEVVTAILDLVDYVPVKDLRNITVIEPAAGAGVFVLEILRRLHQSSVYFGFDFLEHVENIRFFEIDEQIAEQLVRNLESFFKSIGYPVNPLRPMIADFLMSPGFKADIVVGNPPYVRHDIIPDLLRATYRQEFSTFRYRADLYIPFFEKGLRSLNEGGKLAFICANRWLRNQYGKPLRQLIGMHYGLEMVIDLPTAHAFQENVNAYPAIAVIARNQNGTAPKYYEIEEVEELQRLDKHKNGPPSTLDIGGKSENWFHDFVSREMDVTCNLAGLEKQKFQIGIGVATGRDRVFIRNDFDGIVENELLLPIVSSKDLKGDQFNWLGNHILNPFNETGGLIDLDRFPLAKVYFEEHGAALKNRHVGKKRPTQWYRTIDKIDTTLLAKPKILLPDISGNKRIFIDFGKFYPHHNLYFITGRNQKDLQILAAILMSQFVREQLKAVGTQMNGGYPRWQSQNLKKLTIPIIDNIEAADQGLLLKGYIKNDQVLIDQTIGEILIKDAVPKSVHQLELFET